MMIQVTEKDAKALEGYRKLFSFFRASNQNLKFTCEELVVYQKHIENGEWTDENTEDNL